MAENRYSSYLDEERKNGPSLSGMAMLGGVGALAVSSRARGVARGALSGATGIMATGVVKGASYLNRGGRVTEMAQNGIAFMKAMDHALDGRSPLSHLNNPQRLSARFDDQIRREADIIARKRQTPLGGEPLQIQKSYQEWQTGTALGATVYKKGLNKALSINQLKNKMPQYFDDGLESILQEQRDDFFMNPGHDKINALLKKHSKPNQPFTNNSFSIDVPQGQQKQFVDEMFATLKDIASKKGPSRELIREGGNFEGVTVQGAKNLATTLKQGFLDSNAVQNTLLAKTMNKSGYRVAQTRDFLQQDADGKWVNKAFEVDAVRGIHGPKGEKAFGSGSKEVNSEFNVDIGRRLAALANRKDGDKILDLAVDQRVFINGSGHTIDMRGINDGIFNTLSTIRRNTQIPFLGFNPLDLLHWTSLEGIREAPSNYFFRSGTIQPALQDVARTVTHPRANNQNSAAGPLAGEYMYTGGKVYDVISGKMVKDDMYLASARFGMIPRSFASMANLGHVDQSKRGAAAKLFDVGGQETETIWARMKSTVTKFDDPDWSRNRYRAIFGAQPSTVSGIQTLEASYKKLYSDIYSEASMLSDDTAGYLNSLVKQSYGRSNVDLTKLNNEQEIMNTLGRISKGINEKNGRVSSVLNEQIQEMWMKYRKNPIEFRKGQRVLSDHSPYIAGPFQAVDAHETNMVSKIDDVKRLIHQHALEQVNFANGGRVTVGDLVQQGIQNGDLTRTALGEVRDLSVLSKMDSYWNGVYKEGADVAGTLTKWQEDLFNNSSFRGTLGETVDSLSPKWVMGPGRKPDQVFGQVAHIAVNKAKGYQWALENFNEQVSQGIDPLKAMFSSGKKVLGQPFAGRNNIGDVTTATLPFYYFGERLDNTMAKIGLGLSQQNRGSMQSIIGNQFMRRIVMPYMAVQQLQYFDGLTGDYFSEQASETYANMTQDVGFFKDILGINQMGKEFNNLFPGVDQLWKTPIGAAIKYGSFGFLGDSRSDTELQKYYESGEDPIRKGRWWGVGSNTPWQGGAIDYYAPNWYRRQKSDYKFTDVLYGSEGEYWRNHWMPTLSNPIAPITKIFNADHWADKHKDDRPYPTKGGIDELNSIPVIGSLVNRTVGGILNPYTKRGDLEKAHRAYQEEINSYVQSQYAGTQAGGGIEFLPAGGFNLVSGAQSWNDSGFTVGGGDGVAVDGSMIGGGRGSGTTSKAQLAAINLGIVAAAGSGAGSPPRSPSSLDSLRDPDMRSDLADIDTTYQSRRVGENLWYSLTETAGIYGFATNTMAGIDTNKRNMVLAHSSRMNSPNRAFWDLDFGGLTGDFSEIFRRYVPRDVNNYYNPYRNKMPDWMPGVDYYTDFQHGDPYAKIKRGEMRLPGAGYESINRLHSDGFGEYGAFDRFKILADVAPYSNQYRDWRKIVSQMNQAGMLTPEMKEEYGVIRDQVTSKKQKREFYPNKFRNADIKKEKVTITKVLDANTFLTAEYGANPIRLAGVEVPADATEVQEWLQQYIHEGAKVTVGLDADPMFRVRDDTMGTMHAVVYSDGDDMNPWYMSTKGQSVNAMLANRSFGGFLGFRGNNPVKVKNDGSAVDTAALYDEQQITVGKFWETIVHNVLPNVPILGTITDKFMPVRSPLEDYKKNEVYGKAWRPWYDPIDGWIKPMLETMASNNPAVAAAQGYGIGWLFGRHKMGGKYYGKLIGAAVGGVLAGMRTLDEAVGSRLPGGDNYAWIPKRREKERAINEYFDILKYMKFRGLYERASQEALQHEGVDVDALLGDSEKRGDKNKQNRRYLETAKKWLSISKKIGYVDEDIIEEQLDNVRASLKGIDEDRSSGRIGSRTMQALQYKAEYESTLYGADPNGDFQQIFRALPDKDRQYFQHFMTASPAERKEILRLVPKDQRRLYQAKWGMEVDEKQSLSSYFTDHNLPGANWEGWRPDVNLDDIKYKVVRNEGIEATEFGMWGDDAKRSDESGVQEIQPFKPSMLLDVARIEKVLRGAGLQDVNVTMTTSESKGEGAFNVTMNLLRDRMDDIKEGLSTNMSSLFQ